MLSIFSKAESSAAAAHQAIANRTTTGKVVLLVNA
jgi:hypothetical protein